MKERKVGMRELNVNLSACLRHVKSGDTIVISERGKPSGSPSAASTPSRSLSKTAWVKVFDCSIGRGTDERGGPRRPA